MTAKVRGYLVGAAIVAVAVAWVYATFFPSAGLSDIRGLLPAGGEKGEAGAPAPDPPGLPSGTTAAAPAPREQPTSSPPVPQEEETTAMRANKEPAPPAKEQPRTTAPEKADREAGLSASDRERASATAANFVLVVWGYEGADVDEYWSRVEPLVTERFYDSPGGAEVEAGAAVAEQGGPSVVPAYVAESFGGFEVTDQSPDRVAGVVSFKGEESPAGQGVSQEQDLALVRAQGGEWLIDSASEIRTQSIEEAM